MKMRWNIGTLILPEKSTEKSPYAVIVDYNNENGSYWLVIQRQDERETREISEFALEKWEFEYGHRFIT